MANGILIRYGEIWLKKGRRDLFQKKLLNNVRAACKQVGSFRVTAPYGRMLVTSMDEVEPGIPAPLGGNERRLIRAVARVFGIESVSPVQICARTMESFTDHVREMIPDLVKAHPRAATFRVRVNRADKRFPGTSESIARNLGSVAGEMMPHLRVNLGKPDVVIGVEIHPDFGCVYGEHVPGVGGLPVGTSGRSVLLLSGGIDSPVAGWLAAKRGLSVDALYFHAAPHVSAQSLEKVRSLARQLVPALGRVHLHVAHFAAFQEHCRDLAPSKWLVLLYRRQMMRVANRVAERIGAGALVTGETLGQVASQTVANMGVVEAASERPVLRPLVCYDKLETVALAEEIGTYEISILPHDDCCSLFVDPHPETKGSVKRAEKIEERLDWEGHLEQIVDGIERTVFS